MTFGYFFHDTACKFHSYLFYLTVFYTEKVWMQLLLDNQLFNFSYWCSFGYYWLSKSSFLSGFQSATMHQIMLSISQYSVHNSYKLNMSMLSKKLWSIILLYKYPDNLWEYYDQTDAVNDSNNKRASVKIFEATERGTVMHPDMLDEKPKYREISSLKRNLQWKSHSNMQHSSTKWTTKMSDDTECSKFIELQKTDG